MNFDQFGMLGYLSGVLYSESHGARHLRDHAERTRVLLFPIALRLLIRRARHPCILIGQTERQVRPHNSSRTRNTTILL